MFHPRVLRNFDWFLFLLMVIIASFGILNMYSATYPMMDMGGSQVFIRQVYWFLVGAGVFLIALGFNYSVLERWAYPLYFLTLLLLVLVLIIGEVSSGSQRWISIGGGLNIQPSEPAKYVVVVALAKFFSEKKGRNGYRLRDLWQAFLMIAAPAFLIIQQPDLGTAMLLLLASFSLIFFLKLHWKSLFILLSSFLCLVPLLWFNLKEYQKERILSFLRPDMDPLGAGYHINQSKIAIGSGQLWGKGFLEGTQTRLHFLPEQHTDFVFSVWAEEWGFAGALVVLGLYLMLILWGLKIAYNSKDRFGCILAIGIVSMVFWHVVINVGMVTGLLPVVGIPLVFFSYGGSSLISTMAAMGLLMSISMRRFMFQ